MPYRLRKIIDTIGNETDFNTSFLIFNLCFFDMKPKEASKILLAISRNPPNNFASIIPILYFYGAKFDMNLLRQCQSRNVIEALIYDVSGNESLIETIYRLADFLPPFMFPELDHF